MPCCGRVTIYSTPIEVLNVRFFGVGTEPRWAWFRRFNPFVAGPARAILASFLYSASARDALDLDDIFTVTKKSVCGANSLLHATWSNTSPYRQCVYAIGTELIEQKKRSTGPKIWTSYVRTNPSSFMPLVVTETYQMCMCEIRKEPNSLWRKSMHKTLFL